MKQSLALALCLVSFSSSCFSNPYTYGSTGNAALQGLSWDMGSVFPSVPGLDVNGLIYRYTTIKNTEDSMKVHVGNLNAEGEGYIFRETDDWSGLPGNTITKSFSVGNTPSAAWGAGSIEVEGQGSVDNASVIYSYRVDECYDPQLNPGCAGYVEPVPTVVEVVVYDALDDDSVTSALDNDTEFKYDSDGNRIVDEEDEEEKTNLEMGLTATENALTLFKTQGQADIIMAINLQTNIAMYYNSSINGGVYKDNNTLADSKLPDNPKAFRNHLAQQLLHEELMQLQYKQ
jgi:hypothetical protein